MDRETSASAPDNRRGVPSAGDARGETDECRHLIKKEVSEALDRLENNTFGLCEACGDPISEDRLEAMPYARYCTTCGERLDPIFLGTCRSASGQNEFPIRRQSDVIPIQEDEPAADEVEPDMMVPRVPQTDESHQQASQDLDDPIISGASEA